MVDKGENAQAGTVPFTFWLFILNMDPHIRIHQI